MNRFTFPLVKRVMASLFTLVLMLSLCLIFPTPAQAGLWDFLSKPFVLRSNPPKGPSPNRRSGGFGRGGSCPVEEVDPPLMALAIATLANPPETNSTKADQLGKSPLKLSRTPAIGGETTAATPTFWFYVPYTRATSEGFAQFMVLDESKQPLFDPPIQVALANQPGIISVSLPLQSALQIQKSYFWYFSVICDTDRPSRNPSVNGWIQRVPGAPGALAGQDYDCWYDLLNALASARRQSPDRLDFQLAWAQLMRNNKGLEKLAQKEFSPPGSQGIP